MAMLGADSIAQGPEILRRVELGRKCRMPQMQNDMGMPRHESARSQTVADEVAIPKAGRWKWALKSARLAEGVHQGQGEIPLEIEHADQARGEQDDIEFEDTPGAHSESKSRV